MTRKTTLNDGGKETYSPAQLEDTTTDSYAFDSNRLPISQRNDSVPQPLDLRNPVPDRF